MSVASLRSARWMSLGPSIPEGTSTADAMAIAGLSDWDVRLEPTPSFGRCHFEQFDVVRTNPVDKLPDTIGRVGSRYHTFQNEELFAFADNILHGGAVWEALGDLKFGSRVFGAMRLDGQITLGKGDTVNKYLIIHTSHDGSSNISVSVTGLRYACTNSLQFGLRHAKQSFKIRHSASVEGRVAEAREALGLASVYFDEFSAEMNALIDSQITLDNARDIIEAVYPEPELAKAGAHTRWENKVDDILSIYNGETCDNVYGTRYGIMNAMTERLDWNRTSRGGNIENLDAAFMGFDNAIANEKNRILELVRVR